MTGNGTVLDERLAARFADRRVLITGGLGSSARTSRGRSSRRARASRSSTRSIPEYGGNASTSPASRSDVRVNISDVRDAHSLRYLVQGHDVLFNLAGQTSHLDSMTDPYTDLEINCRAQLSILEACRHDNPELQIVFAEHAPDLRPPAVPAGRRAPPVDPVDVNGINKTAGEWYHLLYSDVYGLRVCVLRLTNTYGPRMRVRDARQTFLGIWIRRLLDGRASSRSGRRTQLRDFTYVDDAVDALLLAARATRRRGRGLQPRRRRACQPARARRAARPAGRRRAATGSCRSRADRKAIDIGDYYGDDAQVRSATSAGSRACRSRTASRARSPSTASTASGTGGPRERPVPRPLAPVRRDSRPSSTPPIARRARRRPVRARRGGRGVRARVRGLLRRRRMRSASRPAPTRSSSRCSALGVGPGDEVITAANTCVPTVAGIEAAGARPVLADVDPATLHHRPGAARGRAHDRGRGDRRRCTSTASAPTSTPCSTSRERGLRGRRGCAQAHGAELRRPPRRHARRRRGVQLLPDQEPRRAGRRRAPSSRDDPEVAERARQLRNYGERRRTSTSVRGLQQPPRRAAGGDPAAKLPHLDALERPPARDRRAVRRGLAGASGAAGARRAPSRLPPLRRPRRRDGTRCRGARASAGVETLVHYPRAVHQHPRTRDLARPGRSRGASGSPRRS